jgi:hypothetical protein
MTTSLAAEAICKFSRTFCKPMPSKKRAWKRGHSVTEQTLADGSIKLSIQLARRCGISQSMEVLVKPDGQLTIETKGMPCNRGCDASLYLEQALGQTTAEMLTAQFYLSMSLSQLEREEVQ